MVEPGREETVAEGEENCPTINFEMEDGFPVEDPELGWMGRGALVSYRVDCSEPYLKVNCVGWQDFYSPEKDIWYWNGYYECISDEGGVWMLTHEAKPPVAWSKGIGEGKYKGLKISIEYNFDTSNFIFQITKMDEE